MSKFYTIPTYTGGALGGLMLGAARGEGDSYDKGWTGLLTGLGTTAGIGGSHYLTNQLEKWDDKRVASGITANALSRLIDANDVEVSELKQTLKNKLEGRQALLDFLDDPKRLTDYAFEAGDTAKLKTLGDIYQAAGKDSPRFNQAMGDFLQGVRNSFTPELTASQNSIDRLNAAIAATSNDRNLLSAELASVKKYLNKPMNRLAKKVPLISGLKWLSAIALPAAGFAGAKSLGDYFSSKA